MIGGNSISTWPLNSQRSLNGGPILAGRYAVCARS